MDGLLLGNIYTANSLEMITRPLSIMDIAVLQSLSVRK